jgi:hypothetical protein
VPGNDSLVRLIFESATPDAMIFHTFSGATIADRLDHGKPQIMYTEPLYLELGGADPENMNLRFNLRAVKEGYTDHGNVEVVVTSATMQDQPELEFTAMAEVEQSVGIPFDITIGLNSSRAFNLYGAQLSMRFPTGRFDVGVISLADEWESGILPDHGQSGYDYVILVHLNAQGTPTETVKNVATIPLTPVTEGQSIITWSDAIATGSGAASLDVTAPGNLTIEVTLPIIIPDDPTVWDGNWDNVDISWFTENPDATRFYINSAAQLAGFSAITNGMVAATGLTRQEMFDLDGFRGRTIVLSTDVDLGGIEVVAGGFNDAGTQFTRPVWEGNIWRPISDSPDTQREIPGGPAMPRFRGTFDGGFHTITNMFIPSAHPTQDGLMHGVINGKGFFGEMYDGGTIRNIIIGSGYVRGGRHIGGVVGRNRGGTIENSANFATTEGNGQQGVGGIAGASWTNAGSTPVIRNSFNAGTVISAPIGGVNHNHSPGGIAGCGQGIIENSFNIGRGGRGSSTGLELVVNIGEQMGAMTGSRSGTALITNSHSLSGIINGQTFPLVLSMHTQANNNAVDSFLYTNPDDMKSNEFVLMLGNEFNLDSDNINNGFPILAGMGGTPAVAPSIDFTALKAAIEEAEAMEANVGAFIQNANWARMLNTLGSARTTYNNTNATQAQIDAAEANLRMWIAAVEEVPTLDRTGLLEAIEIAEEMAANPEEFVRNASWTRMLNTLGTARTTYNNANATQAQIDAAEANLRTWIDLITILEPAA